MSDTVRRIADAVLYEGYLLWPYRRSAPKNQQRWNFGCVMPPRWSAEHPDEVARVGTQVLVEGGDEVEVVPTLRFLHLVRRQLFDATDRICDELTIGDDRLLSWDEATEREIVGAGRFNIPASSRSEALSHGRLEHSWDAAVGAVTCTTEPIGAGLHRVSVTVDNYCDAAPWHAVDDGIATIGTLRARALAYAFCSAHLVLQVTHGQFVSPLERVAAEHCTQRRMWPVLVGDAPDRDTILATEIMLDEYPQVAPESPGDLFDGGEVDQLLTLNILGMTDAERAEMRASDPRARAILERTERMTAEDLMRLHGTFRDPRGVAAR